jgi:hypothetical protein
MITTKRHDVSSVERPAGRHGLFAMAQPETRTRKQHDSILRLQMEQSERTAVTDKNATRNRNKNKEATRRAEALPLSTSAMCFKRAFFWSSDAADHSAKHFWADTRAKPSTPPPRRHVVRGILMFRRSLLYHITSVVLFRKKGRCISGKAKAQHNAYRRLFQYSSWPLRKLAKGNG